MKETITERIIRLLEKEYPDATLALAFSNPLQLLIATMLSAQCTDKRTNEVTRDLFEKYKEAEDYKHAESKVLEKDISSISFFRNKAKNIKDCCGIIVDKHNGDVPSSLEELVALPGIGRKTANLVLGNAFGQAAISVDTHVLRVSTRLGLATSNNPDIIERGLCEVIPENKWTKTCHLIQAHGRTICMAKKPSCTDCILLDLCKWEDKRVEKTVKA